MKKYFILILVTTLLLLISCNPDGPGIFYKISVEPPLSSSSLNEKSVYKVVSDGTDTYVLAGGVVYKKNGSDWDNVSTPSGELQAVSLEELSGTLYCVYADSSNSTLYSGDVSSWTEFNTSTTDVAGGLTLVASSQSLFIVERILSTQYRIHNLALSQYIDVSNFVRGAASDEEGSPTDYILASSEINGYSPPNFDIHPEIVKYDGTNFSIFPVTGGDLKTAIDEKTALGGIYADGTNIYITTKTGYVMSGLDTTVATGINNVNTTALENSKLGPLGIVDISGTDYLLIGSDGGFFEMDLSSETPAPATPTEATIGVTEYFSVDLYTEVVHSILADGSDGFYIGTSNGLWYSDLDKLNLK